ncbi:hypothetical protein BJ878DRAFT_519299 [Calycina marina]|uniref:Uncharacterized protein n=1 Tax=Calycina marina TaxID=1763456 RepID=A0A9P7YYX9_9HELO|nr:hypothetical protein BJ878DRAFT_519299 [Calycina marina]
MNQQPSRSFTSHPFTSSPKSQMEAMPPHLTQTEERTRQNICRTEQQMAHDAAMRHPVFFTDRLKKTPAGVQTGNMSWASPIARGYVFEDGERREAPARL